MLGAVAVSPHRQRLAAILVGYSRLMGTDESATVMALDAARAVLKTWIESSDGRVIDMAGDSVLALFETATGAVSTALGIQDNLQQRSADVPANRRMLFRIGVRLGDVNEKADGTVYGCSRGVAPPAVNTTLFALPRGSGMFPSREGVP